MKDLENPNARFQLEILSRAIDFLESLENKPDDAFTKAEKAVVFDESREAIQALRAQLIEPEPSTSENRKDAA